MPEYIEREAFIKRLENEADKSSDIINLLILNGIANIVRDENIAPAADVVEVVHGKWTGDKNKQVNSSHLFYYDDWCCSICGLYYPERNYEKLGKYCPYCGAKMDGK